ncbi:MAG: ORF6N domain-containing protein [Bacteroidia bacterium]|nr:ORF6N domain-containing protein [Bacteroidia bacterium]MCF8426225.1 ORF6N domain-containing protein [Bacteroidia bacterium]MCF8447858.1 ORF6N domain-containing protein [Bacteroidia bacterium]
MSNPIEITDEIVLSKIYHIRGKKVMVDRDLAEMYGVETKVLNQSVKRNTKRFPEDFMFQLSNDEFENWKSQFVTSNSVKMGMRKRPFVFTEQGVSMLSSVLKSDTAIEVNIQIIRIFTRIREVLLTHKDVLFKMEQLEKKLLKQNKKVSKHEQEIQVIFDALKHLLNPPVEPRKAIGFKSN